MSLYKCSNYSENLQLGCLLFSVLLCCAQSCPTLCNPLDCNPPGCSVHGDSPGKTTGVGCHTLLQGIFLTQGTNPVLPNCRQILYQLSHQAQFLLFFCYNYPVMWKNANIYIHTHTHTHTPLSKKNLSFSTVRCHLTPVRMAIKKSTNDKC